MRAVPLVQREHPPAFEADELPPCLDDKPRPCLSLLWSACTCASNGHRGVDGHAAGCLVMWVPGGLSRWADLGPLGLAGRHPGDRRARLPVTRGKPAPGGCPLTRP